MKRFISFLRSLFSRKPAAPVVPVMPPEERAARFKAMQDAAAASMDGPAMFDTSWRPADAPKEDPKP